MQSFLAIGNVNLSAFLNGKGCVRVRLFRLFEDEDIDPTECAENPCASDRASNRYVTTHRINFRVNVARTSCSVSHTSMLSVHKQPTFDIRYTLAWELEPHWLLDHTYMYMYYILL